MAKKPSSNKKQSAASINYVDNKKFFAAIVEYRKKLDEARQAGKEEPRIPDYIGECIYKIANKLSTKQCFARYSYRDEMISDGIENSILYFESFDPNGIPNPFSYFTQVIYYAFLRRIQTEQKNRYAIYKSFQETVINNNDMGLLIDTDGNHAMPTQVYDNINDFMLRFENKEEEKKQKRKIAKANAVNKLV